jgi:leucyl aminopeptidase
VALGEYAAGLFSNDDELSQELLAAGGESIVLYSSDEIIPHLQMHTPSSTTHPHLPHALIYHTPSSTTHPHPQLLTSYSTTLIHTHTADTGECAERVWRMPILPEHTAELVGDGKTNQYDLRSIGKGREGGACTAAAFLQEFIHDGVAWAHLDIAGPAMISVTITSLCAISRVIIPCVCSLMCCCASAY